jgi:two-component system, LytTR family, response regulator
MSRVFKTILIDDERPVRLFTKHVLQDFANTFQIVAEAANGTEAVEKIDTLQPDLIFLDIQMPDYTGFEVLQKVTHKPIVIFLTAYDHFAVKAFEENGLDYLMKPISPERLQKTIDKLSLYPTASTANLTPSSSSLDFEKLQALIQSSLQTTHKAKTITVKQGNKILLLDVEQIAAFIAEEKYTAVKTMDGKSFLENKTLTAFEAELPDHFLRVQKGAIVNTLQIKEIQKHFNGRYHISLKDKMNTVVLSGQTYAEEVRGKLGL